jgi:allantoinase
MQIAAKLGLVVAVHAENNAITSRLAADAIGAGRTTAADYVRSRPVVAEVEAVCRVNELAKAARCQVHVVHISSDAGARAASASDATFETCPHYYLLSEEDLNDIGARAKCAPPLRPRSDADRLKRMLFGDPFAMTFVASDHSPSPPSLKAGDDFFRIWGGIAGVQSTLQSLLTLKPPLPLDRVAALTAENVSERFGTSDKGWIGVGMDADLALLDVATTFELTRDMLLDRHKLSPYVGRTFRGVVKRTIVRGHTVFLDGRIVAGEFRGRLVTPKREGGGGDA